MSKFVIYKAKPGRPKRGIKPRSNYVTIYEYDPRVDGGRDPLDVIPERLLKHYAAQMVGATSWQKIIGYVAFTGLTADDLHGLRRLSQADHPKVKLNVNRWGHVETYRIIPEKEWK